MSDDEEARDRAAVLSRRQLLIASALAGLGCGGPEERRGGVEAIPCLEPDPNVCLSPDYRPTWRCDGVIPVETIEARDARAAELAQRFHEEHLTAIRLAVPGTDGVLHDSLTVHAEAVRAQLVASGIAEGVVTIGGRPDPDYPGVVERCEEPIPAGALEVWGETEY